MTQLLEIRVCNLVPSVFDAHPSALPAYDLGLDLLIRHPHKWKPSRILENSHAHPRLDNYVQMQVMNGHNVRQENRPNEMSTTAMITTMDRRPRSTGEMLS